MHSSNLLGCRVCAIVFGILVAHVTAAEKPSDIPSVPIDLQKLKPLNKNQTVFLDATEKRLVLQSEVVMREGLLEMLVCLKRTKEHESILAVDTKAQIVHAGLLALGAQAGTPVRWNPDFQPAQGPKIQIFFNWTDENEKARRVSAQSWVRHVTRRYFVEKVEDLPKSFQLPDDSELKWDAKNNELLWFGHMTEMQRDACLKISKTEGFQKAIKSFFQQSRIRQMQGEWVFAGSLLVTNEKTGESFYQAESGDLICVANFASATIDIAANSSAMNDDLLFEASTENIPAVGTKVLIELIPVLDADPTKK